MALNENGKFEVAKERCNQCLFGPNKIVDDERRRDVLDSCKSNKTHFICHKFTLVGRDACCYGFFLQDKPVQMLQEMGMVEFVPIPESTLI